MFEHRILVGVDGRSQGHDGVALAVAIAHATGAELLLAHVYEPDGKWTSSQPTVQHALREHNEHVLHSALELVPDDIRAQHAVVGSTLPAPALCGLAQEQACDGIVVGSTHRHLAGRIIIGSTGELLLQGAGLPVAVAPPGFAARAGRPFLRMVAAYDGSPESEAALVAACRFARRTQAELRVISVSDPRPFHGKTSERGALRGRLEESLARLEASADIEMLEGDPTATLLEACGVSDLMFAGSRGHGLLRDELPGAVSAKLIRSCECPVVVLPRAQAAAIAEAAASVGAS
jgi:nucleotide-binding universal stress UspA family protein